jgi:hypothetical protein
MKTAKMPQDRHPANFRDLWPVLNEPERFDGYMDCLDDMNIGLNALLALVEQVPDVEERAMLLNHLAHMRTHLFGQLNEACADILLRDN